MKYPHPVYPFAYDIDRHAIVGDDGRVYKATVRPDGQRMIRCRKARCSPMRFHRLIAECVLGRELKPEEEVDHKNRNRAHNRVTNLRVVSGTENHHNKAAPNGGVSWHSRDELWGAHLKENGKGVLLGYRRGRKEAEKLYADAKRVRLARIDAECPTLATILGGSW